MPSRIRRALRVRSGRSSMGEVCIATIFCRRPPDVSGPAGEYRAPRLGRGGKLLPLDGLPASDQRRRREGGRRLPVDRLARLLRQGGGPHLGRDRGVRARRAAELGYRPNAAARALKTGAARTIALVVPDITNPFFPRLLRGAQQAARAAGYAVALIDTAHDHEWGARSAEALQSGPADGLLLFEVDPPPVDAGWEPIVVIESDGRGHPSVVLDVVDGRARRSRTCRRSATRRIGHLTSMWDTLTFIQRREVLDAMVGGRRPAGQDRLPHRRRARATPSPGCAASRT